METADIRQRELCKQRALIWGSPEWDPNTPKESAFRFGEEALELMQTLLTEEEVQALVRRVFSRPMGDVQTEIGQTGITLAMLAENVGVSLETEMEHHFHLLDTATPEQIEKWRQKHRAKVLAGISERQVFG